MKNSKNILQNNRFLRLVALLAMVFSINIVPMERAAAMMKVQQERELQREEKHQHHKGKYFVYEQGTNNGIWVDQDVVEKCQSIKTMIDDLSGELREIPLNLFLNSIKLVFGVLRGKINVNKLSLEQLVITTNAFNYLDVLSNAMNSVLESIKVAIEKNGAKTLRSEAFKQLNPDIQKLLMVVPVINCLKDLIIKNDLNGRKRILTGHPSDVVSVAFSSDGKKIVSECSGDQNNLILWDVSDQDNLTGKFIADYPDDVFEQSINFEDKNVSFSQDNSNNLIVWDMSDPNAITHQLLMGHPDIVLSAAFSPDGKKIVSGCAGGQNNLILWLPLTDQEELLLNQLKNYNVNQVRLIYQLCLQALKGEITGLKYGSDEQIIFETLPQDMQKLLTDLFFTKRGYFSGWW